MRELNVVGQFRRPVMQSGRVGVQGLRAVCPAGLAEVSLAVAGMAAVATVARVDIPTIHTTVPGTAEPC